MSTIHEAAEKSPEDVLNLLKENWQVEKYEWEGGFIERENDFELMYTLSWELMFSGYRDQCLMLICRLI